MDNAFFTFIRPYLEFIDSGKLFRKPFSWLYGLLALVNLILPFIILYQAIDNRIFRAPAKLVFVFIVVWLVLSFVCWLGFQLWWDRKDKVNLTSVEDDDFVATPVFAHFIQTFGEWLGTLVAVVGFIFAVMGTLFLGRDAYYLSRQFGFGSMGVGWLAIILLPVYGFLIIVISRFLAEQFRALASIANNTRHK